MPDTVDVKVDGGHVVLTGIVDWRYERDAAESTVAMLTGVLTVTNEIGVLAPGIEAQGLSNSIEEALTRNAHTDAEGIRITVADGHVTLAGTVRSAAEHDAAIATASASPGVREIEDRLTVSG